MGYASSCSREGRPGAIITCKKVQIYWRLGIRITLGLSRFLLQKPSSTRSASQKVRSLGRGLPSLKMYSSSVEYNSSREIFKYPAASDSVKNSFTVLNCLV